MAEAAPKSLTTQQRAEYEQLVRDKAAQAGIDPNRAARFVRLESNFDPAARNPLGGAAGLFQFVPETARSMGLDERTVLDAQANADAGIRFMAQVDKDLSKRLGRPVTDYEHYIGHFLGPRGAQNALAAVEKTPNMPMPKLLHSYLSKNRADKQLRDNPEMRKETVGQFIARQQAKVGKAGEDLPSVLLARSAPAAAPVAAAAPTPARMNPNLQAQGEKAAATRAGATPKAATPQDLLSSASQYGPDYQAALALAALGDEDDDEEYTTKSGEPLVRARSMLDEMMAAPAPTPVVASLDLKAANPFAALQPKGGGPVRLAVGGMVDPITPAGFEVQSPFANSANPTVAGMAGNVPRGTMPGTTPVFRAEGSPEQGEMSFKDRVVGAGESAASMMSAMFGSVPAGYQGLATLLRTGDPARAAQAVQQEQERYTYQPRTEAGKRGAQSAAELLEKLNVPAERVGEYALEKTGSPAAATMAQIVLDPLNLAPGPRQLVSAAKGVPKMLKEAAMEAYGPAATASYMTRPTTPGPELTPAHAVSAERPYVSPLEQALPGMQAKMTKEQFLAGLKGKFKDYEIDRAVEALADLPEGAKITREQVQERLSQLYSPRGWRTEVHAPDPDQTRYRDMDNPFETLSGSKVGTINLLEDQSPRSVAARAEANNLRNTMEAMYRGSPEQQANARATIQNFLDSDPRMKSIPSMTRQNFIANVVDAANEVQRANALPSKLNEIHDGLMYPALHPLFSINGEKGLAEQYANVMERTLEDVRSIFQKENNAKGMDALMQFRNFLLPKIENAKKYTSSGYMEVRRQHGYNSAEARQYERTRSRIEDESLHERLPENIKELRAELLGQVAKSSDLIKQKEHKQKILDQARKSLEVAQKPISDMLKRAPVNYRGQHPSIAHDNPIGFARYVDLPIELPQAGYPSGRTVPSMAFLELQPDRLDDIRKYGSRGRDFELDIERRDELHTQENAIKAAMANADPSVSPIVDSLIASIERGVKGSTDEILKNAGIVTPEQKKPFIDLIKIAQERIRLENRNTLRLKGDAQSYNIESPFAGMENKPQEVQQLFIKNAINGAMSRNVNVITFPGQDSAQAQLYRRVDQNAKAVAKELNKITGGGFNVGMLKRKTDKGEVREYPGIWWDAAAAKKLREMGIPFAKGGMVERNTTDNRRYL